MIRVDDETTYQVIDGFGYRFCASGSVRVAAPDEGLTLPHVAFRTPRGGHVLLVSNTTAANATLWIDYKGKFVQASLPAAVATYTW